MAEEVSKPWNDEQIKTEEVSKKQIVEFLQAHASLDFLKRNKMNGKVANVLKNSKKEELVEAYNELFEKKDFKKEGEVQEKPKEEVKKESKKEVKAPKQEIEKEKEKPKFKKVITKKGDKSNFPKKGDTVEVRYRGKFVDGKVFDGNMDKVKNKLPPTFSFKVGNDKIIKGWNEGIITMSVGEIANFHIEAEWAYGKNGIPGTVPPNADLIFDIELLLLFYSSSSLPPSFFSSSFSPSFLFSSILAILTTTFPVLCPDSK